MSICVTGASGFIGSHLAKKIEQNLRTSLVLVDNFSRGKKSYLDYLKVKSNCFNADLRDYENALTFTKHADIVYHCASYIGGMQFLHGSVKKELKAFQENVAIDNNVFRACVENKVKKIIYMSSVSVYNTENQYHSPNTWFSESSLERHPLDPEGGYGWSKYLSEKNLRLLSDTGIKVGIARIFKAYGPCDDYSEESGQVVCSLMRKIIKDEPFIVWGDGTVTRCLVYIDDLIDALILLDNQISSASLIVNIGGNKPYSIKQIAKEIIKVSGKDIEIKYDKTKPNGPMSRIPNLSLAKKVLGWQPTTSLEEGLNKTYHWMKEECTKQ